jgi:hypothetical protein
MIVKPAQARRLAEPAQVKFKGLKIQVAKITEQSKQNDSSM